MDIQLRIWRRSLSAPISSPCSSPNEYCTGRRKREVDNVVAYISAVSPVPRDVCDVTVGARYTSIL